MNQIMPALLNSRRRSTLILVFGVVCIEGVAAGTAALSTRELFYALHNNVYLPTLWLSFLAISGIVVGLSRVTARSYGERNGQEYIVEIRQSLFSNTARMPASDVMARRSGYMSLRFVGDLSVFRNWLSLGLPRLLAAIVLIPITLIVIGYLHLPFLLVVAPLYFLALLVIGLGGTGLTDLHRRVRSRRAAIAADMAERMPIAPQLGQLGRCSTELKLIKERSKSVISASQTRVTYAHCLKVIPDIFAGLSAAGLIWIGALTHAPTATIAGGLAALGIAWSPMRDLAHIWDYWSAYSVARNKCSAALSRPQRRKETKGLNLKPGPVSIHLKNVCIGQTSKLNVRITEGSCVRLQGLNGAGKSLLLSALIGLENPVQGQILLSGMNITRISQGSIRRNTALISDNPIILRGSLRRAFTLGLNSRPSDTTIQASANKLGLSKLIARHGGLDGKIAEGGRTLSQGEKVKVAVLRAMLGAPQLVLIDEQASHLDAKGRKAFSTWLKQRSATVIAVDETNALNLSYSKEIWLGSGKYQAYKYQGTTSISTPNVTVRHC